MPERDASESNSDAIWVVESTDFVTPYAPLPESMSDDPTRLHAAWQLTVQSLERDATSLSVRTASTMKDPDAARPAPETPDIIKRLQQHMNDIANERNDNPSPPPGRTDAPGTGAVRNRSAFGNGGFLGWLLRRMQPDAPRIR